MPNPTLTVDVEGDVSNLESSLGTATGVISKFGAALPTSRIEMVVNGIQKIVEFTRSLTSAGKESIAAENEFARAMEAMGVSMAESQPKIDAAIEGAQKLGFTDDDARAAIETLTRMNEDLGVALQDLPKIMDLARASNKDLATTSGDVADAFQGSTKKAADLLEGLDKNESAATNLETAFTQSKDAATQWADESANQAEIARIAFDETVEAVGVRLTGAFDEAKKVFGPFLEQMGELLKNILPFLNPLVNAFAGALSLAVSFASQLVGWINDLIEKLRSLIDPIQDAIDKLNELDRLPWGEGDFNPGSGSSWDMFHPKGGTPSRRGNGTTVGPMASDVTGRTSAQGGVVINIYGDPATIEAKVARALRDYTRRNGVASLLNPGRL